MEDIENHILNSLGFNTPAGNNTSDEMLDKMLDEARIHVNHNVKKLNPVLSIVKDGVTYSFCNEGGLTTLTALYKGGKTFTVWFLAMIAAKVVTTSTIISHFVKGDRLGIICTEEGRPRTQLNYNKFFPGSYDVHVDAFTVRHISDQILMTLAERYLISKRPKMLIIDLASDLVGNINDLDQSNYVVNRIATLAEKYGTSCLVTIHLGRAGQAIGHIGSVLLKRSEAILKIRKLSKYFLVEPVFTRDEPHPSFSFRIRDGIPVLSEADGIDEPEPTLVEESKILKSDFAAVPLPTHQEILKRVFGDSDGLRPKDFQPRLRKEYAVDGRTIGLWLLKRLQQYYIGQGLIIRIDQLLHLPNHQAGADGGQDTGMV